MKGKPELTPTQYGYFRLPGYSAMDMARYGTAPQYLDRPGPYHDNQLVGYISESVRRRSAGGPAEGGIDDIFQDRKGLIRSKIELILLQLSQRRKISQEVLQQIDQDSCDVQNLIFSLGPDEDRMDRYRLQFERIKLDLQSQRRMELAGYFRDTAMLNRDLKDALIDYLSEVHKGDLLRGPEVKP